MIILHLIIQIWIEVINSLKEKNSVYEKDIEYLIDEKFVMQIEIK